MYGKENTIDVQTDPEEGLVSFFPCYHVFFRGFCTPCMDRPERSAPPRGSFWEVTIRWVYGSFG